MDRQYTRIDSVREILDRELKSIPDEEIKRCAYVHLYGVGQAAAFIAMKRGYGRTYAELAETAGMLHDYAKYIDNEEENHAENQQYMPGKYYRKCLNILSKILHVYVKLFLIIVKSVKKEILLTKY